MTAFDLGHVSDEALDAEQALRDSLITLQTAMENAYTAGNLPQDLQDLLDRVTAKVFPNEIV